ncbi:hypothetical protein MRX96_017880 [Rhipicephalus microplus]
MAAAMEEDEFPTLATASATEQPQRRLTTLRPAKRQKPNDAEDGLESHIPEKTQAQEASITMQEGRPAASPVEAPTKVSMRLEERQEEEGSQVLPATPSSAAAAEAERVADSGEERSELNTVQEARAATRRRRATQPVRSVGLVSRKWPLGRAASNEVAATGKTTRRTASRRAKGHRAGGGLASRQRPSK